MDALTLDTNVLNDWAWAEGKSSERRYNNDSSKRATFATMFTKLKILRDNGKCELGITNQIYTDYEKDVGGLPAFIEDMVGPYVSYALPSISTLPMMFPFVFADKDEIESIMADVFPHTKPEHKKYQRNKKDAMQLYAHRVAGRDIFLTSDKDILAARQILFSKWQISVMTLEEYLQSHG
jgi:hypothetical protein